MPRFISKDGKWSPAKEKVALINRSNEIKKIGKKKIMPGEPYIYEGPDRAALFDLYTKGVEELGTDFKHDPEFINRVRQLGFTMEDYLKFVGYDEKKVEEEFNKKAKKVTKHEITEKAKEVHTLGGGVDTTGLNPARYGGFGEPKE